MAIVNIGGLFGSFLAGSEYPVCFIANHSAKYIYNLELADFAGRKLTIMIGGSLTALGGTLLCTAMNAW